MVLYVVLFLPLEFNGIYTKQQLNVLFNELFANFSFCLSTSLTEQLSQCVSTAIAIDSQRERLSTVTLGQA